MNAMGDSYLIWSLALFAFVGPVMLLKTSQNQKDKKDKEDDDKKVEPESEDEMES
jgi:hypothetical protein